MKTKILLLSIICISIISMKASAASSEGKKEEGKPRVRVGSSVSIGSSGSSSRDIGLRIGVPDKSKENAGPTYGSLG